MLTGKKIKLLRQIHGYTQEELASIIGRTRALVSHIEQSDKVALNLKLTDDAKRQWFGNYNIGVGNPAEIRYDLKNNLMNFGKKNKFT
jgi:transcriptional regulator with XRE-family HTH domain